MFVIKDIDTELYYNRHSHELVELTRATTYESVELAKHFCGIVQHDLAWGYLEREYNIDRWHLDVSFDEWSKAMSLYKNLTVVEVDVSEVKTQ